MLVKVVGYAGAGLIVGKRTAHTTLRQMQSVRIELQASPVPTRALYAQKDLETLEKGTTAAWVQRSLATACISD